MDDKRIDTDYLVSNTYKDNFDIWNKIHNITYEKSVLYYDFILSLYDLIDETYLGSDVMTDKDDCKNHFTWCFDKIISNFEKEKIFFKHRGLHYDYFWLFFQQTFYFTEHTSSQNFHRYFKEIFSFEYEKTNQEILAFTEIYKILEQNLKK